jgi:hypothetical protein
LRYEPINVSQIDQVSKQNTEEKKTIYVAMFDFNAPEEISSQ